MARAVGSTLVILCLDIRLITRGKKSGGGGEDSEKRSLKMMVVQRAFLSTVISLQVMSRFVIIDDTNPSVQYSGPWFEAANNTLPQISVPALEFIDNGPPFQNTLHGVNVTASLSFNFNGMSHSL